MDLNPKNLRAFHGKQEIKDKYIARVKEHQLADAIRQAYGYWKDGKGGAVGCTIESDENNRYEIELGIPTQIAYVEDSLFEALPVEQAKLFPLQFLEAIPVGADLSLVASHLMLDVLDGEPYGLSKLSNLSEKAKVAIEAVAQCYRQRSAGDEPTEEQWEAAGYIARGSQDPRDAWGVWTARDTVWGAWAARDTRNAVWIAWTAREVRRAWAAWGVRGAWITWAARDTRDAQAERDTRDAQAERDAGDARNAVRDWQRDRLLHHLSNAPVPKGATS